MRAPGGSRIWLMVLVVVFALGAVTADSALAQGKNKSSEPVDPRGKAVNLNLSPEMVITRGVLQMDNLGQWTLDGTVLAFDKDSRVGEMDEDPDGQQLQAGYEAMVIAAPLGEALLVRRVTMISPDESVDRGTIHMKQVAGEPTRAPANAPQ